MTEYQQGLTEEMRDTLDELSGDILALENFCRCFSDNLKYYGLAASISYLQRVHNYLRQHTDDVEQIAKLLYNDMSLKLSRAAEAGQVP